MYGFKIVILSAIINLILANAQQVIYSKLEAFIRKYHFSELIKGFLFFIATGLLYFLVTITIEHFLWLSIQWRTSLFVLFILIEAGLFIRFIVIPLLKLFKLRKGLDQNQASVLIGNHFSEVSDTLTNFLQLSSVENVESELVAASINQKALAIEWVPFTNVIEYKKSFKYLPFALLPLLLFTYFLWVPSQPLLSDSYNRFVQYDKVFVAPAPFAFTIEEGILETQQGSDFVLRYKIVGDVLPEVTKVRVNNQLYFAKKIDVNEYEYTFTEVEQSLSFQLEANDVSSQEYTLQVVSVPVVTNFEMRLDYPGYLAKSTDTISGTGNAIIPEGTRVTWCMQTESTDSVSWSIKDTSMVFTKDNTVFEYTKQINSDTKYTIITSNNSVSNFENLSYALTIKKDAYPKIHCQKLPDSLQQEKEYIFTQVSDDYGLQSLRVAYYPVNESKAIQYLDLTVKKTLYDQLSFSLEDTVTLQEGKGYHYYFEVRDNDQLHGYKSSRSNLFALRVNTQQEIKEEQLKQQSATISDMQQSLDNQKKQLAHLDKLEQLSKEKRKFNYNDQLKVKDFVEKQKKEEQMMKQFSKKLQDNLEQFNPEKQDALKDELVDRLHKTQEEIERNEKLLDELNKLNEKIKQEELTDKIDKQKQKAKDQTKSLEQLLELTKKFYVEKKIEQAADELNKLSQEQKNLAYKKEGATKEEQQKIKESFDKIIEDLKDVDKQNKELKSPMSLPDNESLENQTKEELNKSSEELEKGKPNKAKPSQKSASDKMKEMSEALSGAMEAGAQEQLEEDVEVLRQIMDNLLTYSFSQEKLLNTFKSVKKASPSYPKYLKEQHFLRDQFQHIDDSLFVLSTRNPVITDVIIKEIGSVYYNTDKAIASFSETQIQKGVSHQQYVMSSANILADMLSDALSNMQMQMNSSGQGKPKKGKGKGKGGMQLPDVMKGQKGLSEKIKQGMKKGEGKPGSKGKPKPGGQGAEGMSGEVFETYKEQQRLREALSKLLKEKGIKGGTGNSTLNKMQALEKQLLNKGFTNSTLTKSQQLKQDFLKLEKALRKQGQDSKRQATTGQSSHSDLNHNELPVSVKEYLKTIEILNREKLPLKHSINNKVQLYFNTND